MKAFVVGEPLGPEILGILEDYDISHVRFLEPNENVGKVLGRLTSESLLIVNRQSMSEPALRKAKKLAEQYCVEVLEFDRKTRRDL